MPDVQLPLGILGAKVQTFADDVMGAFKKTDGGYMLELEFEATAILPRKLDANAVMGIGVIVNDFDDSDSPEADARLTNYLLFESLPTIADVGVQKVCNIPSYSGGRGRGMRKKTAAFIAAERIVKKMCISNF